MIRLVQEQRQSMIGLEDLPKNAQDACNRMRDKWEVFCKEPDPFFEIIVELVQLVRRLSRSARSAGLDTIAGRLNQALLERLEGFCDLLVQDLMAEREENPFHEGCQAVKERGLQNLVALRQEMLDEAREMMDEAEAASSEVSATLVEEILVGSIMARLGPSVASPGAISRAAKTAAGAFTAMFAGLIRDRQAQGQDAEQIAKSIQSQPEFKGFIAPLAELDSVCSEFQPELGDKAEALSQPGPTRDVDACPLAQRIVDRVMDAVEEAQGVLGQELPLPPDAVARSLSGCQAEVRQVMEACESI